MPSPCQPQQPSCCSLALSAPTPQKGERGWARSSPQAEATGCVLLAAVPQLTVSSWCCLLQEHSSLHSPAAPLRGPSGAAIPIFSAVGRPCWRRTACKQVKFAACKSTRGQQQQGSAASPPCPGSSPVWSMLMTMAALPCHLSRDLSLGVGGARQFWLARCHDLIQVALRMISPVRHIHTRLVLNRTTRLTHGLQNSLLVFKSDELIPSARF